MQNHEVKCFNVSRNFRKRKKNRKKERENKRKRSDMRACLKIPRDRNSADLNFPAVIIKCLAYHTHFRIIISRKIVQGLQKLHIPNYLNK